MVSPQYLRHRGEAVLHKHLRTFEANQISHIIQRNKGKRTLLKFRQFYSAKNNRRDTHKSRKPFFPNWKQQKAIFLNGKPFKKQKLEEKNFRNFSKIFLMKISGKSLSAENLEESFTLAKRFVSCKI